MASWISYSVSFYQFSGSFSKWGVRLRAPTLANERRQQSTLDYLHCAQCEVLAVVCGKKLLENP